MDLAGSERLALIGYDHGLYEEAIFINESLGYLGFVTRNLSLGQDCKHIKYEASILTALLKDTLGGSSKTGIICCISPSNMDIVATTDTLRFSSMAALIKNQTGEIDVVLRLKAGNGGIAWVDSQKSYLPASFKYSACVSNDEPHHEFIGVFGDKKDWQKMVTWYMATHRTDFSFRGKMYNSFPAEKFRGQPRFKLIKGKTYNFEVMIDE